MGFAISTNIEGVQYITVEGEAVSFVGVEILCVSQPIRGSMLTESADFEVSPIDFQKFRR
jgi:hypothetical protein